ncbi:MAG: DUF3108 domain-containing protein [Betaproteobacteria bacterium]
MFVDTKLKLNLSKQRAGRPPWPAALALTLVVVAAHGWLLVQGPLSLGLGARQAQASRLWLNTRSIAAAPAAAEPAAANAKPAPDPPPSGGTNTLAMQAPADAGSSLAAAEPSLPVAPVAAAAPNPVEALKPAAPEAAPAPSAAASSPSAPSAPSPAAPAASPPAPMPATAKAEAVEQAPAPSAAPVAAPPSPPAAERRLALAVPGSARLNYELSGRARGFNYSANGQLDWEHDGQRYQARLTVSSFLLPSRSQTSVGEIGPDGLSPRRYADRSRGELAVHFQPELGRISFSANNPPVPWQPGAQDRLSLTLQLAAMLAGDPGHFAPGATLSILTASSRNVEPWDFTVMGSESLSLPIGTQTALRLKREPRHPYDQTIEIWFAPALGYLPVRILLNQGNGDLVDQRLASIERP